MRSRLPAAPLAALLLLLASAPLRAQEPAVHEHSGGGHASARLGTVVFPSSGAPAARAPFLRGLALLHSFEYDDAASAFRDAQKADAGFAMAYWGEALTHAQLLWGIDDTTGARAALRRLAPTPEARLARAGSPRERAYGAAVEALYQHADLPTRIRAYVASLRELNAAYPKDLEARALLAVALQMQGAGYAGPELRERRLEAIALAQSVFDAQPNHPGGAHYLIHATDNPEFAARGLAAARAYAKIAPDAGHAIHMPSHIFVQLGAWDDVVSSNERAWRSSRAWVKSHGLPLAESDTHVLTWLQYGYLQQGRYAAAKALIDTAQMLFKGVDWATSDAIDGRYALDELRFTYARETGDWTIYGARAPERPAPPTGPPSQRARAFGFTNGYSIAFVMARLGDTTGANALIAKFPGATPMATIARTHLAALSARARGDSAAYLALLREAAAADEQVQHVGPPSVYPAHELLGDALLQAGRPADAIAAYRKGLELMPNRSASLLGLSRALRATGDAAEAAKVEAQLRANWHAADAAATNRMKPGG